MDPTIQLELKLEPEPKPEQKPEPEPEQKPKPEQKPEAGAEVETGTGARTGGGTGTGAETGTEAETSPFSPAPLPLEAEAFWGGSPESLEEEKSLTLEARIPSIPAALPKRLGKFPFWRGEEDLLEVLEEIYSKASPAGMRVFLGERK